MDPAGPGFAEFFGHGDGVVAIIGDGVEFALVQPHHAAVEKIDGWIEDHALILAKLERIRAPTAPERSGWNWQPETWPWRTMAETGTP